LEIINEEVIVLRIVSIIFLLSLPISLFAQTATDKVLVRNSKVNNGRHTISVKWYSKELYYPEGVNIYRKENNGSWQKLNIKPYKKLDKISESDYRKDSMLFVCEQIVNETPKQKLIGGAFIIVMLKSFESETFSRFLGIQYEDSTINEGKTYTYKITRVNGNGELPFAESKSIIAGKESIEEPLKDVQFKPDTNRVFSKWTNERDRFFAVNVYRSSEDKVWKKINPLPIVLSDVEKRKWYFVDTSAHPGIYYYQITGMDFFGKESKKSEPIKVEVKDLIPPPAPINLKDSVYNQTVFLKWTNQISSDTKGLNIYRSTKSGGPFTKVNTSLLPLVTVTYQENVDKPGPYYYYITAEDAAGNESKSELTFAEVHDLIPPLKPVGLKAKADTGYIYLTWEKNKESDLMGYRIFRTINGNNSQKFVLLNTNPIKENSYKDKLPTSAKNKFVYKIIAMDTSFNKSEESDLAITQLPDATPPVQPLLKRVNNIEKTMVIEWIGNKDGDLKGYEVYRSNSKEGYSKINKEILPESQLMFVDQTTEPEKEYFYYLIAIDSAGNKSVPSNKISAVNNYKTINNELKNIHVKYREDKHDIYITWRPEKSESIEGYAIMRSENTANDFRSVSGKLSNHEYYDKEVKAGNTYYYQVRAYDKLGNIEKSEIIKITINQ
jgi:fibronectin type 3 domain-containing protein